MDSSGCIKQLREVINRQKLADDDMALYERYIKLIEDNKTSEPNVSFETTKSLSEAIFRHILAHEKVKGEFSSILQESQSSIGPLYIKTCLALSDLGVLDIEIMKPGKQFFNDVGLIRNDNGLIAHGRDLRELSDLKQSTIELAIVNSFNHLLVILEAYYEILEQLDASYEENVEFNDYLDEANEVEGITYSKALYDQDPIAYNEQLDEYNETSE